MTVLIIEDDKDIQKMYKLLLEGSQIRLLQAFTIHEANEIFMSHKDDINLIYIDGCVPGNQINTLELTKNLRANFHGKMIAISSVDDYNIELVKAGCNESLEKHQVTKHTLSSNLK